MGTVWKKFAYKGDKMMIAQREYHGKAREILEPIPWKNVLQDEPLHPTMVDVKPGSRNLIIKLILTVPKISTFKSPQVGIVRIDSFRVRPKSHPDHYPRLRSICQLLKWLPQKQYPMQDHSQLCLLPDILDELPT